MKITEKELIMKTMEYGFDGSELNNKNFINKGFLKSSSKSYDAFAKKLDAICTSWKRMRKKHSSKDAYYYVEGFKEGLEGYLGGKGNSNIKTDIKIAQVTYNSLLDNRELLNHNSTYPKWAKAMGIPTSRIKYSKEEVLGFLTSAYGDYHANNIMYQFLKRMNRRAGDTMKNAFAILEKEGKIKNNVIYCGSKKDKSVIIYSAGGYEAIKKELESYLTENDMNFGDWYFGKHDESFKKVKQQLFKTYGIVDIFKQYNLELLHNTSSQKYDITIDDVYNVQLDRTLELAAQHQSKMDKKNFQDLYPFDRENLALMQLLIGTLYKGYSLNEIEEKYPDALPTICKNTKYNYKRN